MVKSKHPSRIWFKECKCEHLPGNRFTARVVLAWPGGEEFVGTSQAEDTEAGRLWCAVEATIRALELSVNHEIALKVVEVRTLLEPDTLITITLLSGRVLGEAQHLVGSCIMGEQPERSAALLVLKATNRLVSNIMRSR